jgi:membrane associated rhomboid family serine protease
MSELDLCRLLARSKVTGNAVVTRYETLVKLILPVRAATVRHWPWVTIALVSLNLLSFILLRQIDRQREQRLAVRGLIALVYFQQHPYLSLKAPLDEFIGRNQGAVLATDTQPPRIADVGNLTAASRLTPIDHAVLRQQQAELDGKVSAFAEVAGEWNTASLGYVPRARNGLGLITYQFIHGSWLHVLGNLCFLCLLGTWFERHWGRKRFAVLYLASGIAAAGAHQVLAWQSAVPLIGASGAIAGLLGAFASSCVRAGTWTALPRPLWWRTWRVRASILVLVWFALELGQALLLPRREGSAAHFAHVGGFAFGFVCAWVLGIGGSEGRHGNGTLLTAD